MANGNMSVVKAYRVSIVWSEDWETRDRFYVAKSSKMIYGRMESIMLREARKIIQTDYENARKEHEASEAVSRTFSNGTEPKAKPKAKP